MVIYIRLSLKVDDKAILCHHMFLFPLIYHCLLAICL